MSVVDAWKIQFVGRVLQAGAGRLKGPVASPSEVDVAEVAEEESSAQLGSTDAGDLSKEASQPVVVRL